MFYEILKILFDHVWNSFTAGLMSPPFIRMGIWTSAGFLILVLLELRKENILYGINREDLRSLITFTAGGLAICMVAWFPILMLAIPLAVFGLLLGVAVIVLLICFLVSDFLSRLLGPPRKDGAFRQNPEYYS